jgi:hypothetical protein
MTAYGGQTPGLAGPGSRGRSFLRDAKVGCQYANPVPAGQPKVTAHRGGHAINGMHPPRPRLSALANSPTVLTQPVQT